MKLRKGDIWEVHDDPSTDSRTNFLVTTNSCLKKGGALVMGAGFAKEVRDRHPGGGPNNIPAIDQVAGEAVRWSVGHLGHYGTVWLRDSYYRQWALFQVKRHFKEDADPNLITFSAARLKAVAESLPDETFHLNFPGIGNGRLRREDVLPLLQGLPDNVHVWELA